MRQWAILVGIDNYQSFQSLSYAQRDAQVLQQFLIHEFEFPREQCLLLTNTSRQAWEDTTEPTQATLQRWIERLVQHYLQPGDSLWFFFSGHGVSRHGQDYLVPIDGDPWAVETTCISVTELFNGFKATLPTVNLLVLLDMSRNQGIPSYESAGVGIQTAQMADRLGIPTLLSCQPGQFSREVSGLGHGLFTVALLEALGYQPDITLAGLAEYMSDRLPELSEYYWQPSQRPVVISPLEKLHQPLLLTTSTAQTQHPFNPTDLEAQDCSGQTNLLPADPDGVTLSTGTGATASTSVTNAVPDPSNAQHRAVQQNGHFASVTAGTHPSPTTTLFDGKPFGNPPDYGLSQPLTVPTTIPPVVGSANPSYPSVQSNIAHTKEYSDNTPLDQVPRSTPSEITTESREAKEPETSADTNLWWPVLLWGGLLSLGLIGCVLWRNWTSLWTSPQTSSRQMPTSVVSSPASTLPPTQPTNPPTAIAQPPSIAPTPRSDSSQPTSARVGASGAINPAPGDQASSEPKETGQPQNQALNFNPDLPPNTLAEPSTLERARTLIRSDQATPYRDAIREAKKIQPGDPAYAEAQQEIAVWSQTIFNIARQRANQGEWDIAVMAADMVPIDDPQLRPQAQAAIAEWCPVVFQMPIKTFAQSEARAICNK